MLVLLAGAGSVRRNGWPGSDRAGSCCEVACCCRHDPPGDHARADPAGFVLGLAGYGVALGVIDASSNMQAVALEHRYGRPILPSFHGAWTAGGIVGAAITLATSGLPLGAVAALLVVPLVSGSHRSWRVTTARSTRPPRRRRGGRSCSSASGW